jgi:hypothetical protein
MGFLIFFFFSKRANLFPERQAKGKGKPKKAKRKGEAEATPLN